MVDDVQQQGTESDTLQNNSQEETLSEETGN